MSETVTQPLPVTGWSDLGAEQQRRLIQRRDTGLKMFDPELRERVLRIVDDVREHGDAAVVRALQKFDGVEIDPDELQLRDEEIEEAHERVSDGVHAAIREAIDHVRRFNEQVLAARGWQTELDPGLVVGEKVTPIASAGLFVPSGKASYPSVLVQLGTPAVVAGVPETAVVVPPLPDGRVDPGVLVVAAELGLRRVFRANGPAGVAALALGTERIPKVVKVVGPGSPPVAAAQIECQRFGCVTSMLLGPSESLIVADATADRQLLAADLLNEAEHGPDSASLLVTWNRELVEEVQGPLAEQLEALPEPRRSYAASALANGGAIVVTDADEAVAVANLYAPEHMQLIVAAEHEEALLSQLQHAGEILLGAWTPIAAANYVIGVPAALPTGRFARVSSGVTAEAFVKRTSIAKASREALERVSNSILALAEHEGFHAHAATVRARCKTPNERGRDETHA